MIKCTRDFENNFNLYVNLLMRRLITNELVR